MPILQLPPDMVARIAAGEVIERPASVVKELLDNALDAGASQITVEITGGGVKLIRVVDDGGGILSDEVATAFIRHATSKLTAGDSLESIATLGFRGEALPSIAAVADVTLVSRPADQVSGTLIRMIYGQIHERRSIGSPAGTTVTVRDLFGEVPARRKFLKAPSTETGHITDLVAQYALAFPEVAFSVIVDGRRNLQTPGDASLRGAIAEVHGVETARALLAVDSGAGSGPRVEGFTSPPGVTRSSRGYLSLFVNRRWVQSRSLAFAVEQAYQGLLMTGRSPVAVLRITVPYTDVDVNVHPAKREVRFLNEREVFGVVQRAVRSALVDSAPVGAFRTPESSPSPAEVRLGLSFNGLLAGHEAAPALLPSERVTPDRLPTTVEPAQAAADPPTTPGQTLPVLRVVGQVSTTYIIAEGPTGMYLVDQHAAHERVLFEQALARLENGAPEVQGLLDPVSVELTAAQESRLSETDGLLRGYGFTVESFGDRTYLVRAVPAMLANRSAAEAVRALLDAADNSTDPQQRREALAASLSCHAAVRAGQVLTMEEMRGLLRQLEAAASPHTCPHGRPTMMHLSAASLDRQFGRRG